MIKNIHAILLKEGMDFGNVVKSTLFIAGINPAKIINEASALISQIQTTQLRAAAVSNTKAAGFHEEQKGKE